MKIAKADFIKSAVNAKGYPLTGLPQFAFLGRSNCGKSSLINMLVNRKNLVKTGNTPGMTQLVNFFNINDMFVLVDLPGFGFAKVPTEIRKGFMPMIKEFVSEGEKIKGIFLLVDIRRKPGEEERDIITMLAESEIPTAIIATKADKLTVQERHKSIKTIAEILEIDTDSVFISSAKNKTGRREILSVIASLI